MPAPKVAAQLQAKISAINLKIANLVEQRSGFEHLLLGLSKTPVPKRAKPKSPVAKAARLTTKPSPKRPIR